MSSDRPSHLEEEPEFHLPEHHSPLPQLSHTGTEFHPSSSSYASVMQSSEYTNLRKTFTGFAFPMTVAGLVCYFTYVVLSIFAPGLMGARLGESGFNWGIIIGLAQFAVVYIWTAAYVNFANNKLDRVSGELKAKLEGEATA